MRTALPVIHRAPGETKNAISSVISSGVTPVMDAMICSWCT
jgi:hypothetical protein